MATKNVNNSFRNCLLKFSLRPRFLREIYKREHETRCIDFYPVLWSIIHVIASKYDFYAGFYDEIPLIIGLRDFYSLSLKLHHI